MKVIDSCIMRTRTGGGRVVVGRWRHAVARVIASPVPVDEENPKIWCGTQGSENRYTAKRRRGTAVAGLRHRGVVEERHTVRTPRKSWDCSEGRSTKRTLKGGTRYRVGWGSHGVRGIATAMPVGEKSPS